MVAVVLFALFVFSNVAVVLGYYNTLMGIDTLTIRMVYEGVPVILSSLLLTALAPVNILIAFFTSRGSYRAYKNELLALAYTTPFLVILTVLPGETELTGALQLNVVPLFVVAIGSQLGACHILRDRAWRFGGRDVVT